MSNKEKVWGILPLIYKLRHPGVKNEQIPYMWRLSILQQVWHTIRKWICQVWAPNCATTALRVGLYRMCGFKIGKGTFIGMKCYLDDLCVDKMEIGSNVIISYGTYFACHGRNQGHNRLVIRDNAYIGMRSCIIARTDIEIGEGAIIGAQTLVNKSIPAGKTAVGIPCRILEK